MTDTRIGRSVSRGTGVERTDRRDRTTSEIVRQRLVIAAAGGHPSGRLGGLAKRTHAARRRDLVAAVRRRGIDDRGAGRPLRGRSSDRAQLAGRRRRTTTARRRAPPCRYPRRRHPPPLRSGRSDRGRDSAPVSDAAQARCTPASPASGFPAVLRSRVRDLADRYRTAPPLHNRASQPPPGRHPPRRHPTGGARLAPRRQDPTLASRSRPSRLAPEELVERYRAGSSGPQIAQDVGCSPATGYRHLHAAGVSRRPVAPTIWRDDLVNGLDPGAVRARNRGQVQRQRVLRLPGAGPQAPDHRHPGRPPAASPPARRSCPHHLANQPSA
jgi:hypothetical protein